MSGTTADISAGTEFNLNVNAYGFQGYNSISIASSETSTVGIATTTKIEVRIGNVLSNNLIYDDTSYFTTNDNIRIKSLGITTYSPLNINWLTNVSPKYDVKEVTLTDSSSFTYSIETFAANSFTVGDSVTVIQSDGVGKSGLVIDISNAKKFSFSRAGELTGSTFSVRRDILKPEVNKVNDKNYSYLSKSCKHSKHICKIRW